MLLGQYQCSLDDKRNVVVPPAFREFFALGVYITRGFEQDLLVMSEAVFQERCAQVASLNLADPNVRLLNRLILANACKLELGPAGSVEIPAELAEFAALDKEIVFIGQGDYVEAWSPESWQKQTSLLLDFQANSGRFASLSLTLSR